LTVAVTKFNWIWFDLVVVVQLTSSLKEREEKRSKEAPFKMPPVPIHSSPVRVDRVSDNPLPSLLHTPSGLALLELQGTINIPSNTDSSSMMITDVHSGATSRETPIGRLVFPDYEEGTEGQQWMKKVYLYVGKHQRLTGEVKKLPKAIAVIRRRDGGAQSEADGDENAELEIVDLVKFKILFSSRPEPVGAMSES
jgi:chromosome transmission fidelity protein 8